MKVKNTENKCVKCSVKEACKNNIKPEESRRGEMLDVRVEVNEIGNSAVK